jgi:hypothetical protein
MAAFNDRADQDRRVFPPVVTVPPSRKSIRTTGRGPQRFSPTEFSTRHLRLRANDSNLQQIRRLLERYGNNF